MKKFFTLLALTSITLAQIMCSYTTMLQAAETMYTEETIAEYASNDAYLFLYDNEEWMRFLLEITDPISDHEAEEACAVYHYHAQQADNNLGSALTKVQNNLIHTVFRNIPKNKVQIFVYYFMEIIGNCTKAFESENIEFDQLQ